jgi:hypothetical protein
MLSELEAEVRIDPASTVLQDVAGPGCWPGDPYLVNLAVFFAASPSSRCTAGAIQPLSRASLQSKKRPHSARLARAPSARSLLCRPRSPYYLLVADANDSVLGKSVDAPAGRRPPSGGGDFRRSGPGRFDDLRCLARDKVDEFLRTGGGSIREDPHDAELDGPTQGVALAGASAPPQQSPRGHANRDLAGMPREAARMGRTARRALTSTST